MLFDVEIVLLVRSCNVILDFGTKCNVITVYIYLVSQVLKLNLKLEASLEGSDKARATRRLDCKGMYAAPPERG